MRGVLASCPCQSEGPCLCQKCPWATKLMATLFEQKVADFFAGFDFSLSLFSFVIVTLFLPFWTGIKVSLDSSVYGCNMEEYLCVEYSGWYCASDFVYKEELLLVCLFGFNPYQFLLLLQCFFSKLSID